MTSMKSRADLDPPIPNLGRTCLQTGGTSSALRLLICVTCALAAVPAFARNPDGTLGLIQTPNNGVPVILAPGATVEIVVMKQASLSLKGTDAAFDLTPTWLPLPGGRMKAVCTIPASVTPGVYAVEAMAGDARDRNERAVFIRDAFPESYSFAHVTDVHVGLEEKDRNAAQTFRELIAALNQRDVVFLLVTGDLTHEGTAEQLREFGEIVDTSVHPTFVSPGNHDREGLNYENMFGSLTYAFWFGQDAYLVYDTKDYITADELGPQDAELEILRRAVRPARWSIGATHRYSGPISEDGQRHEPGQGMRSQLTLFVDAPLDLLLFGHWHRENLPQEKSVLWGTTPIVVTPAGANGAFRVISVGPQRIQPMPVEQMK